MREQPSVSWDMGNRSLLASNTNFYIYSLLLHWERDVSSLCHSWRTDMQKRVATSLTPSAILPMTSIQEGLFSKSTSLFGLWKALMKSRRTNRSFIIPRSIFLYLERQFLNLVLPKLLYSIKTSYDYYTTLGCCLFLFLVTIKS